eukprot:scaffold622_cov102-Cylindrotheca_fusiformis.AAC.7
MATDSDDSSKFSLRLPVFLQHRRAGGSVSIPNEMPDLDTTSRTDSSPGSSSRSSSASTISTGLNDQSMDLPWYGRRHEGSQPSLPRESSDDDDSLPVISLRSQSSNCSGLTEPDIRLDSLREELIELRRKTREDNDLSREELMACLNRLDEIEKELSHVSGSEEEENKIAPEAEAETSYPTVQQHHRFTAMHSNVTANDATPKAKTRRKLFSERSESSISSPPPSTSENERRTPSPVARAAKMTTPSPKATPQTHPKSPPVSSATRATPAQFVPPPPGTRPSWNEQPKMTPPKTAQPPGSTTTPVATPAAKRQADMEAVKQRRSQMHLSQPNYASPQGPRYTTTFSPRVPKSAPPTTTRRKYVRPSQPLPTTTQRPASPGAIYVTPGRKKKREPKRPATAPASAKKRVSGGSKKQPPSTPSLDSDEDQQPNDKSNNLIPHASNIEVPPEDASMTQEAKRIIGSKSKSPKSSKKTKIVHSDHLGRAIPWDSNEENEEPPKRQSESLEATAGQKKKKKSAKTKKSKKHKKEGQPSKVKEERIVRAKKRREEIGHGEGDTTPPKSVQSAQSPPLDDRPIGDDGSGGSNSSQGEARPLLSPKASFQFGPMAYEFAMLPRATVFSWNLIVIELILDLVVAVLALAVFAKSKREACCGEPYQRGSFPWIVSVVSLCWVLLEVILLNRAVFATLSQRSVSRTSAPPNTREHQHHQRNKDSDGGSSIVGVPSSTASNDDAGSSTVWCHNSLMSKVNFLTILNPYLGFLIAFLLMYQAEQGASTVAVCIVSINTLLHLISIYLQRNSAAIRKLWVKLAHGSILLPFLCTICLAAWYGQQDGICYKVDSESFGLHGCELCPDGSIPVNGNLCEIVSTSNGESQANYQSFDVSTLDQGDSCEVARRACFIPY